MELKLKNDRVLDASELIFDSKKLIALGRLYHTLKWFVREIWDLRSSSVPASMANSAAKLLDPLGTAFEPDGDEADSPEVKNSKRWSNQEPKPPRENDEDTMASVLLPLRGEIAK